MTVEDGKIEHLKKRQGQKIVLLNPGCDDMILLQGHSKSYTKQWL